MSEKLYSQCRLCARACGINRSESVGYCKMPSELYISRAALHYWEEPIISGEHGSGAIFFSGCSLGCIFCQNKEISRSPVGERIGEDRLADIMLELQASGAHNINLVTPTHYVPSIKSAVISAKARGLSIPIVYNTGSYDSIEALSEMNGIVDVYLPDLKYYQAKTAKSLSNAENYPAAARAAIAEMFRQVGDAVVSEEGIIEKGVVVRVLLLPGHVAEAKLTVKYLYETYGDKIYISLMNQYTPPADMPHPLDRKVAREEYRDLCEYAIRLGIERAFVQGEGTAAESFIPPFDGTGVHGSVSR